MVKVYLSPLRYLFMEDVGVHICKNCGNKFEDPFCSKCGQKEAHRITIGHVLHDMIHVFLHADKGIFPFMKRLIVHPGIMAREYIEGKRRIFNPFQYLIISVGVLIFLMTQSHFYESMESYNNANANKLPGYFQKGMSDFNWFVKTYSNVITFLTLPLYALFSWLFFKKRKENYAEHFTMQVFSISQINTLNAIVLIVLIFLNIGGLGTIAITMALSVISFAMIYKQFYKLKWPKALWKAIVIYACSYISQVLVMGLALLIYILILKSRQA